MTPRSLLAVALVAVCLAPRPASAHARSVSYSTWTLTGSEAQVRVSLSRLDLDALRATVGPRADFDRPVASLVSSSLTLASSSGACAPVSGSPRLVFVATDATRATVYFRARCPSSEGLRLRSRLGERLPGHLHFAQVSSDGRESGERVLGGAVQELAVFSEAPSAAALIGRHLVIGVEHILSGWDHLLFLLVLVIAARRLRGTVSMVTGFTLGHSATLAAAAFGLASPESATVEALVALSIVLVAVENVWLSEGRERLMLPAGAVAGLLGLAAMVALLGGSGALALFGLAVFAASHFGLLRSSEHPERQRFVVAALFGLVHGLAFSGVLRGAGLAPSELPFALFGFNVGVEIGQLAVVALAWPLLVFIRKRSRRSKENGDPLLVWGSAAAACAGTFAFVTRLF